ncbi:MAG: hypothetical protein VZR33_01455 [Methanosphaera sp.]|nr:hypothetical protein [Methanosphaera sp.]
MVYSDKTNAIYFNVHLPDESKIEDIVGTLKDENFIANLISNTDPKTNQTIREKGGYEVIFPALDKDGKYSIKIPRDDKPEDWVPIDWEEFMDDYAEEKSILNELFDIIERYGYTVNPYDKKMASSTPFVIEKTIEALNQPINENMANMAEAIFANIHNPEIQKMLNGIRIASDSVDDMQNSIGNAEFGSAKYVLATKALSEKNTVWILSQWLTYNRPGAPTLIATSNQWNEIGCEVVNPNYPLRARKPYSYNGNEMGDDEAEAKLGVDRDTAYKMDKGVGKAWDRFSSLQRYNGNLTQVIYWDIQDVQVVDQRLWQEFQEDANMENMSHKFNQKALDLMSDDEKNSIGNEIGTQDDNAQNGNEDENMIADNAVNIELTREALLDLIGDNPIYSDTVKLIKSRPDNISDILRSYFMHEPNIDREKNVKLKNSKIEICNGAVQMTLRIGLADVRNKWREVANSFKDIHELTEMYSNVAKVINAVKAKQKEYVMKENRVINEGNEFTFNDFLNCLGISENELEKQIQHNQQMAMEQKQIKSKFYKMWNKIIEANNLNHGVI